VSSRFGKRETLFKSLARDSMMGSSGFDFTRPRTPLLNLDMSSNPLGYKGVATLTLSMLSHPSALLHLNLS